MTEKKLIVLALSAACLMISACTTSGSGQDGEISQIVSLGDSNLDIGRVFTERAGDSNDGEVPPPNTVGFRSSNSTILPEFLSERLNVPQMNFAWGGATSGELNIVALRGMPDVRETGTLAQMREFEAELEGAPADPDALYIVFAGSNDLALIDKNDQAVVDEAIEGAIENLNFTVNKLDELGAEFIVVATRTPRPVLSDAERAADEPDDAARNDAAGRQLNVEIRQMVRELDTALGADVELFDAYAVIRDIADHAESFGFEVYSADPENYCIARQDDCDVLVNYDAAHKTSAVHSIMADKFIAQFELRPAE